MSGGRWLTSAARVLSIAYFAMTSVYCLLYFMPFTYVQLLESELVPALVIFARSHAWLFLPVAVAMDASVRHVSPPRATRALHLGFRVAMGVAGVLVLFFPVLPSLENNITSFVWSQVALVPLLWVACIDLTAARGRLRWSETSNGAGERRVLVAALGASLFGWLVSTAVVMARPGVTSGLSTAELGLASMWSLTAHLVLFLGICTLLLLFRGLAALARKPARVEMLALGCSATIVLTLVIRRSVFAGLAFSGGVADPAAITLAVTLIVSVFAMAVRARLAHNAQIEDGFAAGLRPLVPFPERSPVLGALWMSGLAVAGWLTMVNLAAIDWNYLLQRLTVIGLWLAAFAACYALARPRQHNVSGMVVSVVVPLCALGAFRSVGPVSGSILGTSERSPTLSDVVDRYAGYDVSAGLLAGVLNPRPVSTEADVELFNYLQAYTGIPRSVALTPREVSFVTDASQPAEVRPNIFIIVVDSLRRDYLGAYNSEVTFTPAIDQFASDSLVFEQAFSRYGATGLSEPSIWVGGMLPHKQYVSPFAPMNPLQTLLRAQGYDAYISVDPILDKILEPKGWVTELDQGLQAGEIELRQSLGELQHRLSGRTDVSTPVFAYTQPQNIHISTITRGGVAAVDETSYGDYYAPYASRLRQLDGCFGSFIDYLKVEGLYDTSVVILTSDHGDSLGEGGRFGHAYTIFPEIIRIPLIMHVPSNLTVGLGVDETGLTFSTDITPTLYTLLGFEPEGRGPGSGRPLFTRRADERHEYVTADHLVASSYGPVYGLISDGGDSVYILDSVNYRDHFYDLTTESNTASGRISSARRRSSRDTIRRLLTELNDWYGVPHLH